MTSVWNNDLFIVNEFENETIISSFVGCIKCYDQNGDKVSKNDKKMPYLQYFNL